MKKNPRHIEINNIENPDFLKDLSNKELEFLAEDIREYLIDITSQNGGHLSSNLGVVEATIALCKVFDFKKDKIVFDVGHQCYTYKILTGRNLRDLRKMGGTSGFQKIRESEYDHFEAGHSSTSISVINGFAISRDLRGEHYETVAFIGDSSLCNGLALEGINNIGNDKHKSIIIINDNDMSISTPVGGFSKMFRKISTSDFYRKSKHLYKRLLSNSKLGRFIYTKTYDFKNLIKRFLMKLSLFDYFDFSVIGPVDGHNIKQLTNAFLRAKHNDKTTIVFIKTIKGKGFSFAENDKVGKWHGVGGFNKETGVINNSDKESWSSLFAKLLEKEMENENVITITPGTGFGSSLLDISLKYPSRYIDVGISEEHAFTLAGGLSINGFHPVISIYSTFLQRAYDELSHDIARMNLDATILIDRSGLVGSDGETHQGIYDEAFLISIPNVVISMPSNRTEANFLLKESFNHHGVFAIRYPRENTDCLLEYDENLSFGKWIKTNHGTNIALVTFGPVVNILKNQLPTKVSLYNALFLKPLDLDAVNELLNYNKVVIYDPYGTKNGFASYLSAELLNRHFTGDVVIKAIPDQFIEQASTEQQREKYGLDIKSILNLFK